MKKIFVLCFVVFPFFLQAQKPNISLSKQCLHLNESDSLVYDLYLPADAITTVKFINIFGGDEIVFEQQKQRKSGWQKIVLSSDSLKGSNYSSGVYYLAVSAQKSDGKKLFRFNSFNVPWGKTIDVPDTKLNMTTGEISYTLPQPCFVKVRVGFENGSLIKTLINLEPQAKGVNHLVWDKMDETKRFEIGPQLSPKARVIAFAFPSTAFYLINPGRPVDLTSEPTYPDKWNRFALSPYAKTGWKTSKDVLLQYAVMPEGDSLLTFSFPEQLKSFNRIFTAENEIYISIDNLFMVENPNVLVPGDYSVAFPQLPKGKHTAIVNIILSENRIAAGISTFFID